MKYLYIIIFVLSFNLCTSGEANNKKVEDTVVDKDSLTTKIDAQIMQMEPIDEVEKLYYSRIKEYKDSLLRSVNINNLPEIENVVYDKRKQFRDSVLKNTKETPKLIDPNKETTSRIVVFDNVRSELKEALKTGNASLYQDLLYKEFAYHESFNSTPYSLYMGENYNLAVAYLDIYDYYHNLNYKNYKIKVNEESKLTIIKEKLKMDKSNNLSFITDSQKAFAIWSLITAYKKGEFAAASMLSIYFKEGLLSFPKDSLIANKLDSIYQIRNDSEEWRKSVYIP